METTAYIVPRGMGVDQKRAQGVQPKDGDEGYQHDEQ